MKNTSFYLIPIIITYKTFTHIKKYIKSLTLDRLVEAYVWDILFSKMHQENPEFHAARTDAEASLKKVNEMLLWQYSP